MPSGTVSTWQHPARLLRLALVVAACCWASIALTRGEGRIAAIWLSNGLVLGLLLTNSRRDWLPILASAFVGNVAAGLILSDAPHVALLLSACNSAEVLIAAVPLRRRFGEQLNFSESGVLLWFAVLCVLVAPAISGLLASWLLTDGNNFGELFSIWFAADAMGMLLLTPLVVALHHQADLATARPPLRAMLLPWLLLVSSSGFVFAQTSYPLLFLLFPPLLLLTYRFGLTGAMLGVGTVTVLALLGTLNGHGPFMLIDTDSMHTRILVLQLFVLTAAVKGLVVSLLLAQRERLTAALRRSEQSLRTVTDNLPALIAHLDAEERYRFVNAHIGKIFGGDPQTMLGRTMREVRGETIYTDLAPHVRRALQGESVSFENHALVGGREWHYQSNHIPERAADGRVLGFYAMTFDITERKAAELRQAADEERLRTITDNLPALIAYLDHEGRYRFCNKTHELWFDQSVQGWLGQSYREVLDTGFAEAQAPHVEAALRGARVDTELELSNGDSHRMVRASYLPHRAPDGSVQGLYVLMNDITSLKTVQAQLNQLARFDALTGLANRREFHDRLEAVLSRSRRLSGSHALMFLDIDHFKRINDSGGHAAGDAVLCEIAVRLQASVRSTDTVARLAGDEFVVILDGLGNAEESQFIARKIVAAMEKPVSFGATTIPVAVSIGIAFDGDAALGPEALLSLADSALYEAKAAGRNTWRFADARHGARRREAVMQANAA